MKKTIKAWALIELPPTRHLGGVVGWTISKTEKEVTKVDVGLLKEAGYKIRRITITVED